MCAYGRAAVQGWQTLDHGVTGTKADGDLKQQKQTNHAEAEPNSKLRTREREKNGAEKKAPTARRRAPATRSAST